ncbi:MAG: hypothetical protein WD036_00445 [Bauldia sp.]
MLRILVIVALAAAAAPAAVAADYGLAASPPPAGPAYGLAPACDESSVLARISEKFAYQDANLIGSGIAIAGIEGAGERGLKAGGPSRVDRRYCAATARLSNGLSAEVVYLIEGPKLGTFSIGWNVESCLPGYDPYRVYGQRCRSVRP